MPGSAFSASRICRASWICLRVRPMSAAETASSALEEACWLSVRCPAFPLSCAEKSVLRREQICSHLSCGQGFALA